MILFINKACCGKFVLSFSTVTDVFLVIACDNGKYVCRVGYHQNSKECDIVYLMRKLIIKRVRYALKSRFFCLKRCSYGNT